MKIRIDRNGTMRIVSNRMEVQMKEQVGNGIGVICLSFVGRPWFVYNHFKKTKAYRHRRVMRHWVRK